MLLRTAFLFAIWLAAAGQPNQARDQWRAWRFLIGEWIADQNADAPGATGNCSFKEDLQARVLVRRNLASYPAAGGKPSFQHEDLMIVYATDAAGVQATYWDNEGHVINYRAGTVTEADAVLLVSSPSNTGPRYRLTYRKLDSGRIAGSFDIAAPGEPDSFRTYQKWTMRRRAGE